MSDTSKDAFGYDTGVVVVGPSTQDRIKAVYKGSCVYATSHNSAPELLRVRRFTLFAVGLVSAI